MEMSATLWRMKASVAWSTPPVLSSYYVLSTNAGRFFRANLDVRTTPKQLLFYILIESVPANRQHGGINNRS